MGLHSPSSTRRRPFAGEKHLDWLATATNLGSLLQETGRLSEAEPLIRNAFDGFRAALGDKHPSTLACHGSLASLLRAQGRASEALPLYRSTLSGRRETLGARADVRETNSDAALSPQITDRC